MKNMLLAAMAVMTLGAALSCTSPEPSTANAVDSTALNNSLNQNVQKGGMDSTVVQKNNQLPPARDTMQ